MSNAIVGGQECQERREAEMEFVSSAYAPDEAWCENDAVTDEDITILHRRLPVEADGLSLNILLTIRIPKTYPVLDPLEVMDAKLEGSAIDKAIQKAAINSMPSLVKTCRTTANSNVGEESIFSVFSSAEEWIQEKLLPMLRSLYEENQQNSSDGPPDRETSIHSTVLGRRLIYSHHIIAKTKRADIKALASELRLTGYMKVGWPGILIIEGDDQSCNRFYDAIRPWSWQYLVTRGEQQEVLPRSSTIDSMRKFSSFAEVEEMSTVAEHCRQVGLEALFRTSMKQYDNQRDSEETMVTAGQPLHDDAMFGALILVDHMNDGKGYRKWLRKCSREAGSLLFIKQFYPGNNYSNRPKILVGILGCKDDVATFLRRWRTTRVDVDSKGKACLERQMTVVVEEELQCGYPGEIIDWDTASVEDKLTVTEDQMADILSSCGWSLDHLK